jgi:hypothetical protein
MVNLRYGGFEPRYMRETEQCEQSEEERVTGLTRR